MAKGWIIHHGKEGGDSSGRGPGWEPAAQKGHLDRLLFERKGHLG